MTESTQRAVRKHRLFNANAPAGPAAGVLESTKHKPLHRFAVKTLPRCASALSAGFPPRILPARTNKKGRRCASAPSAPRLLRLRPPPVFDLENYSQQKDLKNPFRYIYLPVRWSGSISIASSRMLRLVSTISALYFGRRCIFSISVELVVSASRLLPNSMKSELTFSSVHILISVGIDVPTRPRSRSDKY